MKAMFSDLRISVPAAAEILESFSSPKRRKSHGSSSSLESTASDIRRDPATDNQSPIQATKRHLPVPTASLPPPLMHSSDIMDFASLSAGYPPMMAPVFPARLKDGQYFGVVRHQQRGGDIPASGATKSHTMLTYTSLGTPMNMYSTAPTAIYSAPYPVMPPFLCAPFYMPVMGGPPMKAAHAPFGLPVHASMYAQPVEEPTTSDLRYESPELDMLVQLATRESAKSGGMLRRGVDDLSVFDESADATSHNTNRKRKRHEISTDGLSDADSVNTESAMESFTRLDAEDVTQLSAKLNVSEGILRKFVLGEVDPDGKTRRTVPRIRGPKTKLTASNPERKVTLADRNGNCEENRVIIQAEVDFPVPEDYLKSVEEERCGHKLDYAAVMYLKAWFARPEVWSNPYPSKETKEALASCTGLNVSQVSNWLRNERKRVWLPLKKHAIQKMIIDFMKSKKEAPVEGGDATAAL